VTRIVRILKEMKEEAEKLGINIEEAIETHLAVQKSRRS